MARNNDRERFKYGICLNEDCSKSKSKEVQQIAMRKEFVCSECGQELRECPPPKKANPKPFIILATLLLVIAGVICGILFGVKSSRNKAEQRRIAAIEQARMDSIAKVEADSLAAVKLAEEQAAEAARLEAEAAAAAEAARMAEEQAKNEKKQAVATGSIDYGKWSGAWKNGKPNGTGTMRYTKEHLIDSRDPQKRTAVKGDYIIGEFANGKLVQGVWYDSANNVKGSIIIGM